MPVDALATYRVRRLELDARVDLERLSPATRRPPAVMREAVSRVAACSSRSEPNDMTQRQVIGARGRRGGAGVALIRQADRNRDGKVDRAELEAYSAGLEGRAR